MSVQKKIGFIIHGLSMGGAEKFMINLVAYFKSIHYQPIIILLSEDDALLPEVPENIPVIKVLKKNRFDVFVTKRIKKTLQQEGINKIVCINSYAYFLTKLAYIGNKDTVLYVSLHSTIPPTKKNYLQNLLYFRWINKQDHFIYICENQKTYLREKYKISPTNESVVYNGIDTNYFNFNNVNQQQLIQLRSQLHIKSNEKIILKVARIQGEKDHESAIAALSILHNTYNIQAHLLLAGSGHEHYIHQLKEDVKNFKLENYVHFLGNQKDVRPYYAMADIFTLTSFSETFSLAALEAMAFGLPCSLTNVGGASEMISIGENGFLSEPRRPKSIAATWHNLLLKPLNKDHIRQYVLNHFSIEKMFSQYKNIIDT